jgi:prevent-host-death family protein
MLKRYSIAEARAHLPAIVDQAEGGHEVELTRRGKPVAVVLSLREFSRLRNDRPSFGDAYEKYLENHAPEKIGLDDDFFESIRDRSPGRKVAL